MTAGWLPEGFRVEVVRSAFAAGAWAVELVVAGTIDGERVEFGECCMAVVVADAFRRLAMRAWGAFHMARIEAQIAEAAARRSGAW
jgi:hypothetical protein